jgi:hypothetical protein
MKSSFATFTRDEMREYVIDLDGRTHATGVQPKLYIFDGI